MKRYYLLAVILFSGMFLLPAQNAGEIIFSKSAINPQSPGTPMSSFDAGDAVYAVAYLAQTVQELYNAQPNAKLDVEVFI